MNLKFNAMKTRNRIFIGFAFLGTFLFFSCNKEFNCHCDVYLPGSTSGTPFHSYDVTVKNSSEKKADDECKTVVVNSIVKQSVGVSSESIDCKIQ